MNDTFTERDRDMIFLLSDSMNRLAAAIEKQVAAQPKEPELPPVQVLPKVPDFISNPWSTAVDPMHPCTNCPSAPHNGGSGICNCTLPYFYEQGKNTVVLYRGNPMGTTPDGQQRQYQTFAAITA